MSETIQTSFTSREQRTHEVFKQAARAVDDPDHVVLAVSGGTDSVAAAEIACEVGPEYGLTPTRVVHAVTGASVPQTRLTARTVAEMHDLEYSEVGPRNPQDALAPRVLANGWPGGYSGAPWTGGHALEFVNRKGKPMDKMYADLDGEQVWISGARIAESDTRAANIPDSGVHSDKPRRTWVSPIAAWQDHEKVSYIRENALPVTEAYLALGFSGECVACAYDDVGVLNDVDLLCPELAFALRSLAVWLYQRARRGDVDIDPKQLCWGWEPGGGPNTATAARDGTQAMVGCSEGSCQTRSSAGWVLDLPGWQRVSRTDVLEYWDTGTTPAARFTW